MAKIVADLSRSMPRELRYQQLLEAIRRSFPCDAIALLELEGDLLIPRAIQGLSPDTMGRRFVIRRHPRLASILDSSQPVRFPADSHLADPYDGLVEDTGDKLYIHDCMGATLLVEDIPWGVVTLDSLDPRAFDSFDMEIFEAFVGVAAATVRAAGWINRLEEQLERRQKIARSQSTHSDSGEIIAKSGEMRQILKESETVASSDLPVLVSGETGVGKELIANYIHLHSLRAGQPMVYVNCAALPETLAETELFGHVKGAFSGATENRAGKFELAHEGTLFLDEVGELPLAVQSKLLRALQNGEIQRVGSDDHHKVDVRLITATNRDLKKEVAEGGFRPDLYHRLSVYPIVVPPLRERPDDILPLAGHFLERDHRRLGIRSVRLSNKAKRLLTKSAWLGNARELEHTLSRAMIRALSEGQNPGQIIELDIEHLGIETNPIPGSISQTSPAADIDTPLKEAVDDYKRTLIEARLTHHKRQQGRHRPVDSVLTGETLYGN
ncbi:MAG: nitric oxide reductase transcriptional regulator NorR [Halioglobus sp.]|nr:nitric oxide reductase transcriptional regulator NorR [Halioglobus sp.]